MSKTNPNPKFIFLTLNFSCNDNNIFEDFLKVISNTNNKVSHLSPMLSFYTIEHDETPNKHLHSLYKCPNQTKPENYKRAFLTQFNNYMKDKYHTTKTGVAVNIQVISDPEDVQSKREYIFKDYPRLKRYNVDIFNPEELYHNYWKKKDAIKTDSFYDVPIICLTSKTILRHTIDFYIKHIEDYEELADLKFIIPDMIENNYSFINCSRYVKEQTIFEMGIRYFKQNKNITVNNIYDTEHKQGFHSDNIFRTVSRILWSLIPYETQQQLEESSAFESLFKYPSQFIEDELM